MKSLKEWGVSPADLNTAKPGNSMLSDIEGQTCVAPSDEATSTFTATEGRVVSPGAAGRGTWGVTVTGSPVWEDGEDRDGVWRRLHSSVTVLRVTPQRLVKWQIVCYVYFTTTKNYKVAQCGLSRGQDGV